ncbi:MAG: dihydrolipoamide acetyltransferase family protein [Verrucomicrobiota bacterium]|nr:dihydrolipoamide acetyltransferase family protein [Verrucomicrobiota bacterium]
MAIIIDMPKLSDTMTAGTLVAWLKKEGDKVANGDKLAEVETDKATMELENFDEGVILKLYVAAGQEIPVGSAICAIGNAGEVAPEVSGGKVVSAVAAPAPKAPSPAPATVAPVAPVPPSAPVTPAVAVVPAPATPVVPVPVAPAAPACVPQPPAETAPTAVVPTAPASSPAPVSNPQQVPAAESDRVKASPLARKVAAAKGVDLRLLKGSGPGGRIVVADVDAAAVATPALAAPVVVAPAPVVAPVAVAATAPVPAAVAVAPVAPTSAAKVTAPGVAGDIPVTNIRKIIAARLLESKTTIPHFYVEIEVDAAPLTEMRASINKALGELPAEQGGVKLTVNDFILKASALALLRVPTVNRSWLGETIRQHGTVNLSFGVAIEDGLVTPVIRDAQTKSLRQIASEAKELIAKARARKLTPAEMTGSTFTVTNLGMYGISNFYGIINPPNAAILSVGATLKKPVVDKDDKIVVGHRMALGISCDHRVVDGAAGAEFLVALKTILENPMLLVV